MGVVIAMVLMLVVTSFSMVDGWMKIVHLKRELEIERGKVIELQYMLDNRL
jgi:hypothetical protein